jgi:hypothetical protein
MTCQRTITDKNWTGRRKRKCGKPAMYKQDDGLPLCARHYKRWLAKQPQTVGLEVDELTAEAQSMGLYRVDTPRINKGDSPLLGRDTSGDDPGEVTG